MDDLDKWIDYQKQNDPDFASNFDEGYAKFKIGVIVKNARKSVGITQDELALKIHSKKSVISRLERHAENCSVATLEKIAEALGKKLVVRIL